ncbi:type II toxin-antitoxin system HipA family toxin [Marinobacterium rhizophilum]|uniref:Type II toxin-antitoxin system HipA family toxin n=1 Tax=Marinobacterium rhizophilum TaxID=420402 RepID=A0ABY5HJI5_9GAMM|nr:HipA domain-containing protein [Marinobacterium rhizophilum]UTW11420.1 type II toxin-antitoxin system HipA family toxin [Marinobacterium rhizophilum]
MTSKKEKEAFVWIWLADETEPVVAGRLEADNGRLLFNYGRSYLERVHDMSPAIPIYEPELPLKSGVIPPLPGLSIPSSIRDAAPDAWGRRVIINKILSLKRKDVDTAELDELTYLLESGSDRIGALDFQRSPTEYIPRAAQTVSMEELLESADRVEKGVPLTPELDQALFHGSSIGGARPKASIEDQGKKYIAKFSSSTDLYDVVKAEFIAMRLAAHAGLKVAPVLLKRVANKDVILVERFDRLGSEQGWKRRSMVSALTILGLDDMMARYASYETLAEIIRHRFTDPRETLKELFCRLVFNVLCGNTDDHARNHAAFWDGQRLTLTPAYDICPQGRTGNEASQAMLIHDNHNLSQLKTCIEAAHHFLLSTEEARALCEAMMNAIETHWREVCDEAELNELNRNLLWGRQFLNPFSIIF